MMNNLDMAEDEVFASGRAHNSVIPATRNEKAPLSRPGTRMTWFGLIFTGPRVSTQSVFYRIPSAFICVHPRLIFYRGMWERGELAG
jgi:hypothetical protein